MRRGERDRRSRCCNGQAEFRSVVGSNPRLFAHSFFFPPDCTLLLSLRDKRSKFGSALAKRSGSNMIKRASVESLFSPLQQSGDSAPSPFVRSQRRPSCSSCSADPPASCCQGHEDESNAIPFMKPTGIGDAFFCQLETSLCFTPPNHTSAAAQGDDKASSHPCNNAAHQSKVWAVAKLSVGRARTARNACGLFGNAQASMVFYLSENPPGLQLGFEPA